MDPGVERSQKPFKRKDQEMVFDKFTIAAPKIKEKEMKKKSSKRADI